MLPNKKNVTNPPAASRSLKKKPLAIKLPAKEPICQVHPNRSQEGHIYHQFSAREKQILCEFDTKKKGGSRSATRRTLPPCSFRSILGLHYMRNRIGLCRDDWKLNVPDSSTLCVGHSTLRPSISALSNVPLCLGSHAHRDLLHGTPGSLYVKTDANR